MKIRFFLLSFLLSIVFLIFFVRTVLATSDLFLKGEPQPSSSPQKTDSSETVRHLTSKQAHSIATHKSSSDIKRAADNGSFNVAVPKEALDKDDLAQLWALGYSSSDSKTKTK